MTSTTGGAGIRIPGGEVEAASLPALGRVCREKLLWRKWLISPSHRVGHQWVENLVRGGQAVVNLHLTTVIRLALELVGADLAKDGLALASRSIGALIVDATWKQLNPSGYLGRLDQSVGLSTAVYDSLLALRLAGCGGVEENELECGAKAADIKVLLNASEAFLKAHKLVDEAEVLRRAIEKLSSDPQALGDDALVFIPAGTIVAGLEKRFLEALPTVTRIEILPPNSSSVATDIKLLAHLGKSSKAQPPPNDGSVYLFRAVGEINEVREVLRRALAQQQSLDDIEVLHTDAETYLPLIFGTCRRLFSEPDRSDGVPVTFAEGLPASLSRPARALVAWLHWIREGYPQRLLAEMIGDGLINCGDDDELRFGYLSGLLRHIGIGLGADHYLPKLDEQIQALGKMRSAVIEDDEDNTQVVKARERKLKGLKALRKLVQHLLRLSQEVLSTHGTLALQAAEKFLDTVARSVSELDRYATEALVEQIQDRRIWQDRLGVTLDSVKWLSALPAQTHCLGSGPRPGHLHVAHIASGGHSGRNRTYVIGLDDRRFPGAALQDPVLLDRERTRLSPELLTSAAHLRHRIEAFTHTISMLTGSVTLSWPCQVLDDDRETFPSSVVMSVYRLISGDREADLEALNIATAPPISFAPTSAEKSLDESERWLWRLSDDQLRGANPISQVEACFPHLAVGSAAQRQRASGFGAFNGYLPQAGKQLDPFAANGPVLSASALETAGRCPLAFFFRNGLRLYPSEELEIDPDRWIDAAQFGSLLHDVFRRFMDELSGDGQRPNFERDHKRLAQILQKAVEQWRQDVPPSTEHAFRMQYWQLVKTARIFLQTEEEFCQTSQPRYFEVALGMDSAASPGPLNNQLPTTVTLPSGSAIRARGQVDRVDETGTSRYAVWDYKIGSASGYDPDDPFRQGRRVQSVLYQKMIESAIRAKVDPQAIVERFGYFFPSIRAHGRRVSWSVGELAAGLEILDRICASIAAGAFLATDNSDDCRYCDYAPICRNVDQTTSHSEALLDRDDLVPLKHFRELRRG